MTEKLLNILQTKTAFIIFCVLMALAFLVLPKDKDTASAQWVNQWSWGNGWNNTIQATPAGTIYQQYQMMVNGSTCQFTAYIGWQTQNVRSAQVTISQNGGQDQVFATGINGSQAAPWINAGSNYKFTLWDTSLGNPRWLADTWVVVPASLCTPQQTNPYPTTGYQYPTNGYNYTYMNSGYDGGWSRNAVSWAQGKPLLIDNSASAGTGWTNTQTNTSLNSVGTQGSWQQWINSRPLLIDQPQNVVARDSWGWTWN